VRYKKYNVDLGDITKSNVLPDLSSIHNNLLEDSEYLRKETMLDGIVVYRARNPFSKLISMNLPEDHPAFNFDIGVLSCVKCYLFHPPTKDIERHGNIRDLLFRYIVHPLFNSLKK
jgi:hypothetical protein